ncbi:helix-turn-helix transcriptional regulator (plasmid) [Haloarcula sp. NS06]|uniref:helix-turn-helix transcriptional regulator n=1 Tax=Haloarcula sp. NS06 TaxID=3409688 RepID=UPI003DA74C2D
MLDADGVLPQSEIGDRTDLSKATVSRTLDSLEARDLVERKRRGMGNIVLLT